MTDLLTPTPEETRLTLPGYDATHRPTGGHQPTVKRTADKDGPDFYPTPPWATHALLEVEQFSGVVWEPACGDGAMAKVLRARGLQVVASDLYDRDYGQPGVDFLAADWIADHVITNPPFHSAEGFVRSGLRQVRGKVAMLLRLAFAEGVARAKGLHREFPAARVWTFPERVTFYAPGKEVGGGSTTAYAWWVWEQGYTGETILKSLPVGLKAKYGGGR